MKEKTLKRYSVLIAIAVLLTAAGNMLYAASKSIPEPLLMEVHEEVVFGGTYSEAITFAYITNSSDARRLQSIRLDGLEWEQPVSQSGNPSGDIIGRYYTLKSSQVDLYLTEADLGRLEEAGSLTLTTGTVRMSDGTDLPVSIGRIRLYTEEHWNEYRLRDGGGGSNDHFTVDFKTEQPIRITSLDLSSFEPHQEALEMALIVDGDRVYPYDALVNLAEPIPVSGHFQMAVNAVDPDLPSQWRFNMLSMDMAYEKGGQVHDAWIYYPFYGSGMDPEAVEAYVAYRRNHHD